MKKENKNFLGKWIAFVVAVAIFFVGGLLSGMSIAEKNSLQQGDQNVESCKAGFDGKDVVVTREPITEMFSTLGVAEEVNGNEIKISYQAQPFDVSGGKSEQKELQVSVDANTKIQFSQKLPNGDENIEEATVSDITANATLYVFTDDNILENDKITATKIKIIK